MIDDLYDDRLAAIDGTLSFGGTVLLVGAEWFGLGVEVAMAGGLLVIVGVTVFTGNMLLVVHRHSPQTFDRVLFGSLSPRQSDGRSEKRFEENVR